MISLPHETSYSLTQQLPVDGIVISLATRDPLISPSALLMSQLLAPIPSSYSPGRYLSLCFSDLNSSNIVNYVSDI